MKDVTARLDLYADTLADIGYIALAGKKAPTDVKAELFDRICARVKRFADAILSD